MYLHNNTWYNIYCASQDFLNSNENLTENNIFMHCVAIPHLNSQHTNFNDVFV